MLSMYIAVSDFDPSALKMLEKRNLDITLRQPGERPDENELIDLVNRYDIIVIGAKEKLTAKVYESATKLKIIGTLSIGIDHISQEFIDDKKIRIINCPNSNVSSTAEHTFALILALSKKIIQAHKATCALTGRSGMGGFPTDLFKKTIGVIGCGRIGSYVIELAKAFNMNILCCTAHPKNHKNILSGYGKIQFVELTELLTDSDIITIHLPLTSATENFLDARKLALISPKSILINTSRLDIVDNDTVLSMLNGDLLKGYAIDLDVEQVDVINSLSKFDNVVLTPHTAGVSIDSMIRMDTDLALQFNSIIK